jgi:hypothetical protein
MAGKKTRGEKADAGRDQAPASEEKTVVVPRLQERYQQQVLPALREKLGRTNPMALPRLEKIVVSMGVGAATQDKKVLETGGHPWLVHRRLRNRGAIPSSRRVESGVADCAAGRARCTGSLASAGFVSANWRIGG